MTPAGLPHSEIPGSKVVCTSPRLIAAYHVLRRFPEPRHPPYALILLDFYFRLSANTLLNSAHPLSRNRSFFPPSWKNGTCQRSTGSRRRALISRRSPGTSLSGPSHFASIQHHCLPETSAPPCGPPPGREAISTYPASSLSPRPSKAKRLPCRASP